MTRRLFGFLCGVLLVLSASAAEAQIRAGRAVRFLAALPATCVVGDVVSLTASPFGLHECLTTNTWTLLIVGLSPTLDGTIVVNAASDTRMRFDTNDPDNADFYINLSNTANAGSATRPNPVMQWGYNLNPGGGPVTTGETAFGFGLEGHYEPASGSDFHEAHLYLVDKSGVQHRPWSWKIDKDTGDWLNLIYASSTTYFEKAATASYLTLGPGGLVFRPMTTSGVATDGLSIEADSAAGSNMIIASYGSRTKTLQLSGFNSYTIGTGVSIQNNGTTTFSGTVYSANFTANASAGGYVQLVSAASSANTGYVTFLTSAGSYRAIVGNSSTDFPISLYGNANFIVTEPNVGEHLRVTAGTGNLGLGTATFGTSAAKVFGVGNGTAPTTSPADMIQLYAEDVAASSELKVRDEAGNTTVISPHNFSLLGGPSEPLAWSFYSERNGEAINVDMLAVIREVERLSGKSFVKTRARKEQ